MAKQEIRKWCYRCKKLVLVPVAVQKCPDCESLIPIGCHEIYDFPRPKPPPPGSPTPAPPPGLPSPEEAEPSHLDIIEILERVEKRLDFLAK